MLRSHSRVCRPSDQSHKTEKVMQNGRKVVDSVTTSFRLVGFDSIDVTSTHTT